MQLSGVVEFERVAIVEDTHGFIMNLPADREYAECRFGWVDRTFLGDVALGAGARRFIGWMDGPIDLEEERINAIAQLRGKGEEREWLVAAPYSSSVTNLTHGQVSQATLTLQAGYHPARPSALAERSSRGSRLVLDHHAQHHRSPSS